MEKENIAYSVEELLHKAKWKEGRSISLFKLQEGIAIYKGELPLLDLFRNFYAEFGELEIRFFNPQTLSEDLWETDFDKATEFLFPGDVTEEYMPRVSCQYLIPFGYWTDPSRILFMDELGKVYLGADDYLALLGNTFKEAFKAVITGRKPLIVYS